MVAGAKRILGLAAGIVKVIFIIMNAERGF